MYWELVHNRLAPLSLMDNVNWERCVVLLGLELGRNKRHSETRRLPI